MKDIKVSVKLIASYILVAIIAVAVALFMMTKMKAIDDADTRLYQQGTVPLGKMTTVIRNVQAMRIDVYKVALAATQYERESAAKDAAQLIGVIRKDYELQKKEALSESVKDLVDSVLRNLDGYHSTAVAWVGDINTGKAQLDSVTQQPIIPEKVMFYSSRVQKFNNEFVEAKIANAEVIVKENTATYVASRDIGIVVMILMFLVAVAFGIYMTHSVTKPLGLANEALGKGAKGDMTVRVPLQQKDEFGQVADSINLFFSEIQKMITDLKGNANSLAGASEELSTVSKELASSSEETVNQSNTGASGAEEASVNASEVAGAAEEMSTNMNTVAAAVEELSASISNIEGSADLARDVSTQATAKASEATEVMNRLGEAAKNIGNVTNAIKTIADKTNLLALNATIEAASAGEAGKGFAVVANEIKELANQSAKSADDIAQRIDGMQNGTNQAVSVIGSVSQIIGDINQSVTDIAGHVEQQSRAVNEIASNVSQANIGAKRVASAIGEVAKGAKDISESIGMVSEAARQSAQGAGQVHQSSTELSKMAGDLKAVTDKFTV
jgi:methyl-accepting chemotaxis protein